MNEPTGLDELRSAFANALTGDAPDVNRILELSAEVARQDPDNVRFSTDAGIISRLGRELVAKEETAVAELIKNAYDADATSVRLTFKNSRQEGGTLIIEDDGLGMTREQLVAGFMRLSSSDKVLNPVSTRYHRKRAGRKGIGRFAVQRLGTALTIITQTVESNTALRVEIDWESFTGGRELTAIANKIEVLSQKEKPEGTKLILTNLREGWTEKAILRVYRYVSELQQPYPLHTAKQVEQEESSSETEHKDPGFKTELVEQTGDESKLIANEETEIFSHALATINGHVDEMGYGYWSLKSPQLEIEIKNAPLGAEVEDQDDEEEDNEDYSKEDYEDDYDSDDLDAEFEEEYDRVQRRHEQQRAYEQRVKAAVIKPFAHLKNVSLRVYYFIWDPELVPRSMFATLRNLGKEKGGVRIYRNGFRVPPYGQKEDDWLGLDASYGRRKYLPPHGNNSVFGFIEIIDNKGELFEETSSREGLLDNQTFKELKSFAYRIIISSILSIAEARGRKLTTRRLDWNQELQGEKSTVAIKEAAERLAKLAQEARRQQGNSFGDEGDNTTQLANDIIEAADRQEALRQQLIQELGLLRVLASLGLVIGEFTHEVRQLLGAAYLNARSLVAILFDREADKEIAEDLLANIQSFRTYASYFDRSISDNALRELTSQDLRLTIRNFANTIRSSAKRRGIELEEILEGYDLLTPPMHSSELSSLLFNLFTNAQKAIRRSGRRGKIQMKAGAEGENVYLTFSDNGDGIPEENRERIFNAFFTTSSPVGQDSTQEEELQGTGLGLKIVKDIVEGYDGEIYLSTPPEGYTTCFRVELPRKENPDID